MLCLFFTVVVKRLTVSYPFFLKHPFGDQLSPTCACRLCMCLHSQEEMDRISVKANPLRLLLPAAFSVLFPHVLSAPRCPVVNNCEWHLEGCLLLKTRRPRTLHAYYSEEQEEQKMLSIPLPPTRDALIEVKKKYRMKKSFVRCSRMPSAPLSTIMNIAWSFGAKSKDGCSSLKRDGGQSFRWRRRNERSRIFHRCSSAKDGKYIKKGKANSSCESSADERLIGGEECWHWWESLHMPLVCFPPQTCLHPPVLFHSTNPGHARRDEAERARHCAHLRNEGGGAEKMQNLTSLQQQDVMLVLWHDGTMTVEPEILKASGGFCRVLLPNEKSFCSAQMFLGISSSGNWKSATSRTGQWVYNECIILSAW